MSPSHKVAEEVLTVAGDSCNYAKFPRWIYALAKGPRLATLGMASLSCAFLSAIMYTITANTWKQDVKTLSPEWQAASKDYMKFQKMNPIFGISSKGH